MPRVLPLSAYALDVDFGPDVLAGADRDLRRLRHGRKAIEPIPDATLTLGHLWTGKLETRGATDEECLRWLVRLRLGWQRRLEEASSPAGSGLLIRPVLEFLPCVHRLRAPYALAAAYEVFHEMGELAVGDPDEFWLYGSQAGAAHLRVPAAHTPPTDRTVIETWDLAEAVAGDDGELAVRLKRLLRSFPPFLLAVAAHPARFVDGVPVEQASFEALEEWLDELHAKASSRGRRFSVNLPDVPTDILMDFPGGRHPGQRGDRSPVAFAAGLAREFGLHPLLDEQSWIQDHAQLVREHTETWREKQQRTKHVVPLMVLLPDLGWQLDRKPLREHLDRLVVWTMGQALGQPELVQAVNILDRLRFTHWEPSTALQGWPAKGTGGLLSRVDVGLVEDDIEGYGAAALQGATIAPLPGGWRWGCWTYEDSLVGVRQRLRATGLRGDLLRWVHAG